MLRFLSWLSGIPLAIAVVLFAAANHESVQVGLWPLPWIIELPLYLLALAPLVVGLLVGLALGWIAAAPARKAARAERRRSRFLEGQVRSVVGGDLERETSKKHDQTALPRN
ncbi:DUF1049 domain-containing protein [Haematospirillum jordaniae]|uniref:Uncharacterized protein n=1 Tax=Haematospirillum jordaniae TaxID=1549855 RepID=A0A143DC17_9PROT|nr:lipopolysaccharide assembly protein LapA domain-containing protein [Haematospirillum jordaniae]AMW34264.1 hypothetical protein AY555_02675 [Haematospirillum jordaniae]NKD45111.1 DUF1049 domain-containing protein [Haematospirillum jordaniae]NKD58067.1 DUF1049 domain-containing protein [Haematospirillum jordaniae]NKD60095.1 DUF1049 domain-containing protein [Haematospirillum jordaniae]NKD68161.1 DUF1049 domain-containing protein [Haematospirillum jordaniae]